MKVQVFSHCLQYSLNALDVHFKMYNCETVETWVEILIFSHTARLQYLLTGELTVVCRIFQEKLIIVDTQSYNISLGPALLDFHLWYMIDDIGGRLGEFFICLYRCWPCQGALDNYACLKFMSIDQLKVNLIVM